MMSKKDELEENESALKASIERQLADIKDNVESIGKTALLVGGGFFAAYLVVRALTTDAEKEGEGAQTKAKKKKKKTGSGGNLLSSAIKEQAIVFFLGLAAQKLATFLKELDSKNEDEEEYS